MRIATSVIAIIAVLLCAGCGSGSGSGGSVPPADTGSGTDIGSRALPGYTVRLTSISAITPGSSLTVEIQMTPDSGQTAPALIEAAVGVAEPVVWVAAMPKPGVVNVWTWSAPLPADLSGLRAWVRVSDAEGNVSQSGGQDFALEP